MRERWARFESSAWSDGKVDVRSLDGVDELNRLFRFDLLVDLPHRSGGRNELLSLVDQPASLWFEDRQHVVGQVHGIVTEVSSRASGNDDQRTQLELVLVPRLWSLTQTKGSEIFLDRTIPQVLEEKLQAHGFKAREDFLFALTGTYPIREFIVQFDETDHAFVSRLCEHVGIAMAFDHASGRDVVVFTDSQEAFHPIPHHEIHVRDRALHPSAYDLRSTVRRTQAQSVVRDYNYRNPRLGLEDTRAVPGGVTRGDWTELTSHAKTPHEITSVARIRGEEMAARHYVVEGTSTEMGMRAGGVFRLIHARDVDEDMLALKVTFRLRSGEADGDDVRAWINHFTAIPKNVAYRPERVTPWPRVPGMHNAIVDGEIKGHFAELDADGRYHVRMQYDRSGRTDLGATHPVRMMQPHAGANYGMHFPLRPGTEVLIGFVNGDPDRPIIVGTAPNPTTKSPVEHANETQNVLRTGSNNEVVIEDLHGSERIRIHSPHMNTTLQLGAQEEAEEGALTTTRGHISEASRGSNNEATTTKTLLADTSSALLGRSAVIIAGVPAVTSATGRGIESPDALSPADILRDLRRLSAPPGDAAVASGEEQPSGEPVPGGDPAFVGESRRLWSDIAGSIAETTTASAVQLVHAAAEASDRTLGSSLGRAEGEPLGKPLEPAVVLASARTASMVARDTALVFGDRVAALSSADTASVVGGEVAQLKSPGTVEVAAGREAKWTTAGELDVAAKTLRIVAGYYPEAEAPPLADGTSLGMMSRRDLRVVSVEDCILLCAQKNLIASAHEGEMRLTAKQTVVVRGGSVAISGSPITLDSGSNIEANADGDILVKASGEVVIEGANVTIKGGSITLDGNVLVTGNLFVVGSVNK